ncbi:MAG TPA: histidine phosphatase family protein [Pedobacter sp.]|jgi:phosphohistidine phosphatase
MKQLLIVRHAKSDWTSGAQKDFDRPLNKRGFRDAPEMADRLLRQHLIPQLLVSSPALRAYTTASIFAEIFNIHTKEIKTDKAIYEASSGSLLHLINAFDNRYNFIALFGHNPGITNLAINLCNTDVYDIPTCGMILIEFPIDDWKMVSKDSGEQTLYDYPKSEED